MTSHPAAPPTTQEALQYARDNPGGWLYEIDPFFDPAGEGPPHGVVGAWRIDDDGHITEDFQANPNYLPSPHTREFPEPTDALDGATQLAATGYTDNGTVMQVLLESQVVIAAGADN